MYQEEEDLAYAKDLQEAFSIFDNPNLRRPPRKGFVTDEVIDISEYHEHERIRGLVIRGEVTDFKQYTELCREICCGFQRVLSELQERRFFPAHYELIDRKRQEHIDEMRQIELATDDDTDIESEDDEPPTFNEFLRFILSPTGLPEAWKTHAGLSGTLLYKRYHEWFMSRAAPNAKKHMLSSYSFGRKATQAANAGRLRKTATKNCVMYRPGHR